MEPVQNISLEGVQALVDNRRHLRIAVPGETLTVLPYREDQSIIQCLVLCVQILHSCCPERWRAEHELCGYARAAYASFLLLCSQSTLLAIQLCLSVTSQMTPPR